jgi:hypothetical protein
MHPHQALAIKLLSQSSQFAPIASRPCFPLIPFIVPTLGRGNGIAPGQHVSWFIDCLISPGQRRRGKTAVGDALKGPVNTIVRSWCAPSKTPSVRLSDIVDQRGVVASQIVCRCLPGFARNLPLAGVRSGPFPATRHVSSTVVSLGPDGRNRQRSGYGTARNLRK